jgi:sugar phosphate isomerase/epimerase
MQLNLSAGTLHNRPLVEVTELAAEIGFSGLEVIINRDFEYGGGLPLLTEVQKILPVASLHAPFYELNGWGDQILQLQKTVELALACNIPLVNFHPPDWMSLNRKFWRWMNQVEDFQQQVGQGRVTLTLENMPATGPFGCNRYFLHQTEDMLAFAARRNLFFTFDTAHMGTCKRNFLTDFHFFYNSGRIRNVHFSDYGYGREHLIPGRGVLPLTRFLNHLQRTGYNGIITLELMPSEFPEEFDLIRTSLIEVYNYLCSETRASNRPKIEAEP